MHVNEREREKERERERMRERERGGGLRKQSDVMFSIYIAN